MKKLIVLYRSKTGFSKRYAEWIAEDLACECRPIKGVRLNDLNEFGLVIYGAGIYSGMIAGAGRIKHWMEQTPNKTWVVFATGATPPKAGYEELIQKTNFRQGEARPARFFYLLAGIDYQKMGLFDRLLMAFFSRMEAKKHAGAPAKPTSIDLSNRSYLENLLRYARLKAK